MTKATEILDSAVMEGAAIFPDASEVPAPLSLPKAVRRTTAHALQHRSLKIGGGKTSIALEPIFWDFYDHWAKRKGIDWVTLVVAALNAQHTDARSRAAVLRVVAFQSVLWAASDKKK